jgi:hypothetical protein
MSSASLLGYDIALELLRKVISYNKSCFKAFEYLGFVASYADACNYYESAFSFSKSPSLGYKLAFNHLKAKNYTAAIDISEAIYKEFPQFEAIKTDVYQIAITQIRELRC